MGYERQAGALGLLGVNDLEPIWVPFGALFIWGPLGPFGIHSLILGPRDPFGGARWPYFPCVGSPAVFICSAGVAARPH